MKKANAIVAVILLGIYLLFMPIQVTAADVRDQSSELNVVVDQVTREDLYITGKERVTINAEVQGDLFVASGIVTLNADVKGDLYIAGGQINVNQTIEKSVYAGGGQIAIAGDVKRNLFVAGGDVKVTGNIGQSVMIFSGNVDLQGSVTEDVLISAGNVDISGKIGDDLRSAGGVIRLSGEVEGDAMVSGGQALINSKVKGDLYLSGEDLDLQNSTIAGDLIFYGTQSDFDQLKSIEVAGQKKLVDKPFYTSNKEFKALPFFKMTSGAGLLVSFIARLVLIVVNTLGFTILGYLIYKYAPKRLEQTVQNLTGLNQSLTSLGVGVVAIPTAVFVMILLAFTVIGWPLLGFLAALWGLLSTLVVPVMGLWLGIQIFKLFKSDIKGGWAILLGVFVIQIVKFIPCLGALMVVIFYLMGMGALLRTMMDKSITATAKTVVVKNTDKAKVKKAE